MRQKQIAAFVRCQWSGAFDLHTHTHLRVKNCLHNCPLYYELCPQTTCSLYINTATCCSKPLPDVGGPSITHKHLETRPVLSPANNFPTLLRAHVFNNRAGPGQSFRLACVHVIRCGSEFLQQTLHICLLHGLPRKGFHKEKPRVPKPMQLRANKNIHHIYLQHVSVCMSPLHFFMLHTLHVPLEKKQL